MKKANGLGQQSILPLLLAIFMMLLVGIAATGSIMALGSKTTAQDPDFDAVGLKQTFVSPSAIRNGGTWPYENGHIYLAWIFCFGFAFFGYKLWIGDVA